MAKYTNDDIRNWSEKRSCVGIGPSAFYPIREQEISIDILQLCDTCPVNEKCAEQAIATEEPSGYWGGLNMSERNRIMAARRHLAANPNFEPEEPPCRNKIKVRGNGFKLHIDLGEVPCRACRIVYREKQIAKRASIQKSLLAKMAN